ncbi:MAG: hypothetical protein L6Q75_19135 [Burkholderiaceae bacterium]|nr:hypothetical protein [Burkholderiaceae bacterium]
MSLATAASEPATGRDAVHERWRLAALGVAALAYAALAHQVTIRAAHSPWALLAVLGPMAALLAIGLWRGGQRLLALALAAGLALLAWRLGQGGAPALAPQWLYLAQHAGIHVALGLFFGRSLRPGRQALISALAERVHRGLTPALAGYTRRLTAVWTGYFAAMASLSVLLFLFAPLEVWSAFANLVTPLALAVMFVGEHLLRYRLHPEFERISLSTAIRAYAEHRQVAPGGRSDGHR